LLTCQKRFAKEKATHLHLGRAACSSTREELHVPLRGAKANRGRGKRKSVCTPLGVKKELCPFLSRLVVNRRFPSGRALEF